MTRLILDYYRRWGLVLAIGTVPLLILGWWIAVEPKTPIEFIVALLPVWILYLFDLSRGAVRVLRTLPLTPRQIGRSWWLVNVLIPAIVVAALLFLGAGSAVLCHPYRAFPLHQLSLASLLALLWLGTVFIPFVPASRNFNNWGLYLFSTIFVTLLTVFFVFWMVIRAVSSFSGFLLSQDAAKSPVSLAILLAGGAFLTFVGWFRAERFDPARGQPGCPKKTAGAASFRPTLLSTAPHQPPEGYGGIPFLLHTAFFKGFLVCLTGAMIWGLILRFEHRILAWPDLINSREGGETINPVNTMLWMLLIFLFPRRPSLTQLRFLRTLPISAAKLAAVIIASLILPFIATGTLMAGAGGLSLGIPAALTILKSCILVLAPAALCIFFAVWRGSGIQAYVFFMVTMMVWVWVVSALRNITFPLVGGVGVGGVMLAWLLTYYALLHSSRAYRAQANPLGSLIRTVGR